jgi:Mrp family chromosome partitioning ATPase
MIKNITYWLHKIREIRICFDDIKNELYLSTNDNMKKPFVVAITSFYRGEGVSTVALGMAYSIAQFDNKNVLFVDSSSHQINTDKVLGVNRPPGLFEIKVTKDPIPDRKLKKTRPLTTPYESTVKSKLFTNINMDTLLPTVDKHNYQYIIIELPSLSEGASTIRSAKLADGVILVIQAEKVRREVAQRTYEKFEKAGVKLFGVVLNKRKQYIPEWIYSKI